MRIEEHPILGEYKKGKKVKFSFDGIISDIKYFFTVNNPSGILSHIHIKLST